MRKIAEFGLVISSPKCQVPCLNRNRDDGLARIGTGLSVVVMTWACYYDYDYY